VNSISPRGRRELTRFMKFSVVGVIGAIVDFGTFNLLNSILGLRSLIASVLSFIAAVTSNFIWNRFWTYPDSRSKPVRQQALQFAVVNTIGLFIRTPVFAHHWSQSCPCSGCYRRSLLEFWSESDLDILGCPVSSRNRNDRYMGTKICR